MHIGTAGWTIASHYRATFAGSGSHLQRYAQRLNAAEINSSFHRHHQARTYARWAAAVPRAFRFSVKLPRTLTHDGKLLAESDVLDRFIEEVRGLGDKLAVLLVQLPPRLVFDEAVASAFFDGLRQRIDVQVVCEPRHPSWSALRADVVLAEHAVARVAADPPPWPGADEPGGCRGFTYFRWHGQPRRYYSNYAADQLAFLQQRMRVAGECGADVWAIFDNTALGCALGNALEIAHAVPRSGMSSAPSPLNP